MYSISSEQIIGSYAVRYKTLVSLVNKHYAGCNDSVINIFIDLAGMYNALSQSYNKSVRTL